MAINTGNRERMIGNRGRSITFCLLIALSVLHSGCGSDSEEEQTAMPEESLQSGWLEYGSGNYGSAILAFEKVISDGADASVVADAYNGLGWVYLGFSQNSGVNKKNLETALGKFQEAITLDTTNADAWVGLAGLYLARRNSQADFQDALKAIDNALDGNAKYLYRHDYDSEADPHALKVQCYYYLGEFDKARDEIDVVLAVEKNNGVALAVKRLL